MPVKSSAGAPNMIPTTNAITSPPTAIMSVVILILSPHLVYMLFQSIKSMMCRSYRLVYFCKVYFQFLSLRSSFL